MDYVFKRRTEYSDFAAAQLNTVVSVYDIWEYSEVMV